MSIVHVNCCIEETQKLKFFGFQWFKCLTMLHKKKLTAFLWKLKLSRLQCLAGGRSLCFSYAHLLFRIIVSIIYVKSLRLDKTISLWLLSSMVKLTSNPQSEVSQRRNCKSRELFLRAISLIPRKMFLTFLLSLLLSAVVCTLLCAPSEKQKAKIKTIAKNANR